MNIFFVIDGEVVTPQLLGSVLPGITRKSAIEICKKKGYKVSERKISIEEIAEAYDNGKLDEVFGTGTAAAVKRYQARHGLAADGTVGKATWEKLFPTA